MSEFTEVISEIHKMNAELEAMKKTYMSKLQEQFQTITSTFFKETGVQAVIWTQYTPYFNDGEECVFSVNTPTFIKSGFDLDNTEDDVYEYEDDEKYSIVNIEADDQFEHYSKIVAQIDSGTPPPWFNPKDEEFFRKRLVQVESDLEEYGNILQPCVAFSHILTSNEEMLRSVYGDHCIVILTKDITRVEEYEHD